MSCLELYNICALTLPQRSKLSTLRTQTACKPKVQSSDESLDIFMSTLFKPSPLEICMHQGSAEELTPVVDAWFRSAADSLLQHKEQCLASLQQMQRHHSQQSADALRVCEERSVELEAVLAEVSVHLITFYQASDPSRITHVNIYISYCLRDVCDFSCWSTPPEMTPAFV